MPVPDLLALAIFALLYLLHLGVIAHFAVDVPFWDEWGSLRAGGLLDGLSLDWLFRPHNEHLILPTRLQMWLNYRWLGLDLGLQQIANFLIFGALIALLLTVLLDIAGGMRLATLLAFTLGLLSPIAHQNHSWGFQSQIHFALLFFLGAVHLLFAPDLDRTRLLAALLAIALAALSSSAGLLAVLPLLLLWPLFRLGSAAGSAGRGTPPAGPSRALSLSVVALASVLGLLLLAALAALLPSAPLLSIGNPRFWSFLLNLVSLGFGVQRLDAAIGLGCLAVVCTPLLVLLFRERGAPRRESWALTAIGLGILSILAGIALARGQHRLIDAKASRYAEFACLLLPVAAVAWHRLLARQPRARTRALILLWLLAVCGYRNDWSLAPYRRDRAERLTGLECIRAYYQRGGAGRCPTLHPRPLAPELDRARAAGLSFTRRTAPAAEGGAAPSRRPEP